MKFTNKFRLSYLLLAIVLLPACSFFKSDIKEIDSLIQAQEELKKADQKTLVVFDMDDTLVAPIDKMFYVLYKNIEDFDPADADFAKQLREDIKSVVASKNDPDYSNKATSAAFAITRFAPIEPCTVSTIRDLQMRDVKVIALTASNTGNLSKSDS